MLNRTFGPVQDNIEALSAPAQFTEIARRARALWQRERDEVTAGTLALKDVARHRCGCSLLGALRLQHALCPRSTHNLQRPSIELAHIGGLQIGHL